VSFNILPKKCGGISYSRHVVTCQHFHARYELYGVVAHSGRLASSGHYLSYIRDREASSSYTANNAITAHSPTSTAIKSEQVNFTEAFKVPLLIKSRSNLGEIVWNLCLIVGGCCFVKWSTNWYRLREEAMIGKQCCVHGKMCVFQSADQSESAMRWLSVTNRNLVG